VTPIQSLRYLQGFALGDGWIHNRLDRFRIYAYDAEFVAKVRELLERVKTEFGLTSSESGRIDRLTGTYEWSLELGGAFAVERLDLGLTKSPEGLHFLAGLWDADGGWYSPDESHPLGQARMFGGSHRIRVVKHQLKLQWGIATGRMSIVTHAGHTSKIGDYTLVTRTNVYGTTVRARSMRLWIELVGSKMLLKCRPQLLANQDSARQEKSFTP
jgi:hypothetical protein